MKRCLVRAHRQWSRIESTRGPEPYIRQAVLRQYLTWRRRQCSTEIPSAELPDAVDPGEAIAEMAARDEMWLALAALPRAQRAVMVLRYYEDLSDVDIANLLDCTVATVRVHAFKALKRLRAAFDSISAGARGL